MKNKKNIITEINQIRHLMGLNEQSHADCEKQLEKAGYVVYNKSEQKTSSAGCENKPFLQCVKKWMTQQGIDSNNITIKKHSGVGNCYLMHSVGNITHKGKNYPNLNYTFWDNGRMTYIDTLSVLQKAVNGTIEFAQVQYDGKFECDDSDPSNIILNYKNLTYSGVYSTDNPKRIDTKTLGDDFMILDNSGNPLVKISELRNTNHVLTKADLGY